MPRRSALYIGPSWWIMGIPLFVFFTLPLAALLLQNTPGEVLANLKSRQVHQAIGISLKTTTIALFVTIILGTPLALVLARHNFPTRKAINTLIDLPMVLPPAVAGVALLIAFGRNGLIGQYFYDWGIQIPFTQTAVIMAQIFVSAPLFVRSAIVGIARIDDDLEEAALLDGANTWKVLRHVTFPIVWPALLGGAVLAWARALGEFGATIIFAGNLPGQTQTMPLAIYVGFELNTGIAITLSVILLGTSFVLIGVLRYLLPD